MALWVIILFRNEVNDSLLEKCNIMVNTNQLSTYNFLYSVFIVT